MKKHKKIEITTNKYSNNNRILFINIDIYWLFILNIVLYTNILLKLLIILLKNC